MANIGIYKKLLEIQTELKAPKGQYNSFGKYKYRSCEDILEAVKPICKEHRATLYLSDCIENVGDRYYIKAIATLYDIDDGSFTQNTAYAREEETKKGMDGSQITGTASSYARKYALNGLFCIDDTKDADTNEFKEQTEQEIPTINKIQEQALYDLIKERAVEKDHVIVTLKERGYNKLSEIKLNDYMAIKKEFENFVRR